MKPAFLSSLSPCLTVAASLLSSARAAVLLLIVSSTLASSASAQQFKVTATGKITTFFSQMTPLNSTVAVGTPFTFSYLFDYSAPTIFATSSTYSSYSLPGANAGANATFGDYEITPGPSSANIVTISHAAGNPDRIVLLSNNEATPGFGGPYDTAGTNIQLIDSTGLFSSNALPSLSAYNTVLLDGADFTAFVQDVDGYGSIVRGPITSLSATPVAPVPEASTTVSLGVMLALGGLVLVVKRARRRSRT